VKQPNGWQNLGTYNRYQAEEFGRFVHSVPPPLSIGTVCLDSGESVQGFLCEAAMAVGAKDISSAGGWRQYLAGSPCPMDT
jgi:allophanate hydrolase